MIEIKITTKEEGRIKDLAGHDAVMHGISVETKVEGGHLELISEFVALLKCLEEDKECSKLWNEALELRIEAGK